MFSQWYAVLIGLLLFVIGILLFGNYTVEGIMYAWLYFVIGLLGLIIGLVEKHK
ncbi:hypothetical protein HYW32_00865 [Candidatus Berkelbacteria bacterium]|nr:hypothetical protein [Candidatus Berkelbacteria bacterium]